MIKKDVSHIAAFNRDVLFLSLYESLRHRNTAVKDAAALTNTVISHLHAAGGVLEVNEIISQCKNALARFDNAAYVHYQAFHP